jgi:hypothetical protein
MHSASSQGRCWCVCPFSVGSLFLLCVCCEAGGSLCSTGLALDRPSMADVELSRRRVGGAAVLGPVVGVPCVCVVAVSCWHLVSPVGCRPAQELEQQQLGAAVTGAARWSWRAGVAAADRCWRGSRAQAGAVQWPCARYKGAGCSPAAVRVLGCADLGLPDWVSL